MFYIRAALLAWNYRREIGVVAGVMGVMIIVPIFAVVGLLNTGSVAASDALASVNPVTHRVEVKDPSGKVIATIEATTAWPIKGTVTQEFGVSNLPYQIAHSGIDIDGGFGAPVTAFMAGKVSEVGDVMAGCGSHCVIVDHGYGITSVYAHMSAHSVTVGQEVKPGDVVGKEGEEGWAHGAHLHFEIRIAKIPVNPRTFLVGNPQARS